MASPEEGKVIILDQLAKLSEPFGTTVTFEDGIGMVRLPST
jgi:hypothetical protein